MGFYPHSEGIGCTDVQKVALDALHLKKIELADEVLILDAGVPWCEQCGMFRVLVMGCAGEHAWDGTLKPYIGESTKRELEHALKLGKKVRYLSQER